MSFSATFQVHWQRASLELEHPSFDLTFPKGGKKERQEGEARIQDLILGASHGCGTNSFGSALLLFEATIRELDGKLCSWEMNQRPYGILVYSRQGFSQYTLLPGSVAKIFKLIVVDGS